MNISTLIVLLLVALLTLLAVRRIRRKKLMCSCGGDCARCGMGCASHTDGN